MIRPFSNRCTGRNLPDFQLMQPDFLSVYVCEVFIIFYFELMEKLD